VESGDVAAIANTSYRSPSLPNCLLTVDEKSTRKLLPREQQMLECFALGLTNAQAAERLNLHKIYSKNLLAKLGVKNRQLALLKVFGKQLLAPS